MSKQSTDGRSDAGCGVRSGPGLDGRRCHVRLALFRLVPMRSRWDQVRDTHAVFLSWHSPSLDGASLHAAVGLVGGAEPRTESRPSAVDPGRSGPWCGLRAPLAGVVWWAVLLCPFTVSRRARRQGLRAVGACGRAVLRPLTACAAPCWRRFRAMPPEQPEQAMNGKSHVSLEQHVCLVCGVTFDTQLRSTERRKDILVREAWWSRPRGFRGALPRQPTSAD